MPSIPFPGSGETSWSCNSLHHFLTSEMDRRFSNSSHGFRPCSFCSVLQRVLHSRFDIGSVQDLAVFATPLSLFMLFDFVPWNLAKYYLSAHSPTRDRSALFDLVHPIYRENVATPFPFLEASSDLTFSISPCGKSGSIARWQSLR